jgi:hypothetical protein
MYNMKYNMKYNMRWINSRLLDENEGIIDRCFTCECSLDENEGNIDRCFTCELQRKHLLDLLELNVTLDNFKKLVKLCELLEVTNPDKLFDKIFKKLGFDVVHEFGDYYKDNSERLKPHDRKSLSRAIKLYCMDKEASCKKDGHPAYWDVSIITDMSDLFAHNPYGKKKKELCEFNDGDIDISRWDVSNVDNMARMFRCSPFNGDIDISRWNVRKVKDMSGMFERSNFNGNIEGWNVKNVKNMSCMFAGSKFNGNLKWNTISVTDMSHMFSNTKYAGKLELNVRNVKKFNAMFRGARINGDDDVDLSKWVVDNGHDFSSMFCENPNFNGNVSGWDMKKAVDLSNMFNECPAFDRDVSEWDLRSAEYMYSIFREGPKFLEVSPFKNITASQTEQLRQNQDY